MLSSIKVDLNIYNQPVITIHASQSLVDLRDKALRLFLDKLHPRGRLCFIDFNGFKRAGSFGEDSFRDYTITPIPSDHYELLLKEISILIQERDLFYKQEVPELDEKHFAKKREDAVAISDEKFQELMNY